MKFNFSRYISAPTIGKSCSRAGCPVWRRILRERKPQDSFRLHRVRRAGNIVKRAGAQSSHVSIPFGEVRKHNHRGASGCGRQNAHRSAKIAIRQFVAAEHKLKRLLLDAGARVCQGSTTEGLQPQVPGDFFDLLTLKGIRRHDQRMAGVEHFLPPSDRISSARERQLNTFEIILSAGAVATDSRECALKNKWNENQSKRLNS
jgi:hypothetical protein